MNRMLNDALRANVAKWARHFHKLGDSNQTIAVYIAYRMKIGR